MSGFFTVGEQKIRPGVYKRYENAGLETARAEEGIAAAVVCSNWGPLNTAMAVDGSTDMSAVIGTGNGAAVVQEILNGGAPEVILSRVGSGGEKGTMSLQDSSDTGTVVIRMETKYPSDREFSLSVKPELDDPTVKTATLYEETKELETRSFMADDGQSEIDAFVEAFATSQYITVAKVANGNGEVGSVVQVAFKAGKNPSVKANDYGNALAAIESEEWNILCVDSNATEVHSIVFAFINRIYIDGNNVMAVIGEGSGVDMDTRITRATSYNDEKMVYVLNGFIGTDGTVYQGYLAAARVCGMIAACPASQSLTHRVISGATTLSEAMTTSQIKKAIKAGCFLFSVSRNRQVQVEYAINTLVTLSATQDSGWKKIRRVKTRFELIDRIEKTIEPMIGQVNNDTNGRATIIAAAQRICDAMIGEHKLIAASVVLDSSNPPEGDSAWFNIAVDDVDSLEKMYLTFRFRFSQNS